MGSARHRRPAVQRRLPRQGSARYPHGANVPWYNRSRGFGCGGSNGGVSDSRVNSAMAPVFGQALVQATVKSIADAVHAYSTAYVTVGSAMLDGLPMWVGLGLDYYEAHWYDYMNSGNYDAML